MEEFITRKEICEELEIDDEALTKYEQYLELPHPIDDEYPMAIAKAISRLHELTKQGFDFSDIKTLSFFAEQYQELVPALRAYADLSSKKNMRDALKYYQDLLKTFGDRENKYKERILELEDQINQIRGYAEENDYLNNKVARYEETFEEFKEEYTKVREYVAELESKNSQYEHQCNDLYYQLITKENTISKLQDQLAGNDPQPTQSAIDIEALLKKKEKEFEIKHQRKIFDLKKQVETIVAQKEQEWIQKLGKAQ